MRIIDSIKIALTNAKRIKSNYLVILLIVIASGSALFSISYKKSFDDYWNKYVLKNPESRIYNVYYKNIVEEEIKNKSNIEIKERNEIIDEITKKSIKLLESNNHILGASQVLNTMIKISDLDSKMSKNEFYLFGVPDDNNIEIYRGNNFNKYKNEENIMICPGVINYMDSNTFDSKNNLDITYLLNKEVNINILDSIFRKVKIIGFYDTFKTYSMGITCYTNYSTLKKINDDYYANNFEKLEEIEKIKNSSYYNGDNIYIMVDDNKNLSIINKFLNKNNMFLGEAIVGINTETVDSIMGVSSKILISSMVIIVIVLTATFIQNTSKRKKEIRIYESVGYSKFDITKIVFIENLIIIIIGYILSLFITKIGLFIFKTLILTTKSRLYLMKPNISLVTALCILLPILLIPFIVTLVTILFSKKNYVGE